MKTTYIQIPVVFEDDGVHAHIDLTDDGVPGAWGDTFVSDGEDGMWVFDPQAQASAWALVSVALAHHS